MLLIRHIEKISKSVLGLASDDRSVASDLGGSREFRVGQGFGVYGIQGLLKWGIRYIAA